MHYFDIDLAIGLLLVQREGYSRYCKATIDLGLAHRCHESVAKTKTDSFKMAARLSLHDEVCDLRVTLLG